jgi:hypothetical protein
VRRRVEQVPERGLERARDLGRVEHQFEAGMHQADDRRDAKPGDHRVVRQATEYFDEFASEPDLLLRLA